MITLYYATTSEPKVRSLRRRLAQSDFVIEQRPLAIPEPRLDRVEDTAMYKALFAFQEIGQPVLANDAGFFIPGLRGFPSTFVNFSLRTIEVDGLLRLAAATDRSCFFRHALSYHDGRELPVVFADEVHGHLSHEPRGHSQPWHWSVLALVFIPLGEERTLGEMTEHEWAAYRAPVPRHHHAAQFAAWFEKNRRTR